MDGMNEVSVMPAIEECSHANRDRSLLFRNSRHHRNPAWHRDWAAERQCRFEVTLATDSRGLVREGLAAGLVSANGALVIILAA
jgi:hypothetical protein